MQIFGVHGDGLAFLSASGGVRAPDFKLLPAISDPKLGFSGGSLKNCSLGNMVKLGIRPWNYGARSSTVRASGNSNEGSTPIVPLQFESPTGQFLSQILQTHPHLLPAAIDQQLETLQTEWNAQKRETPPPLQDLLYKWAYMSESSLLALIKWTGHMQESGWWGKRKSHNAIFNVEDWPTWQADLPAFGAATHVEAVNVTEISLSRRIEEVKNKERRKALEEIIYCLIVNKFMDKNILMIPAISLSSGPAVTVDSWPNQEKKLESVHSPEAFEMIQSHLSLVLGERLVGPLSTVVQISKIRLGKLYAASIMYGYFLKRVDQRFQLERSMNTLSAVMDEDQMVSEGSAPGNQFWNPDTLIRISTDDDDDDLDGSRSDSGEAKSYKLRSYVMYLDSETLQRYATIRSKEAISLIEKQTQALFGRPDISIADDGSFDPSNDEMIGITFSGLTMLVLEAVAFGSFLWDAEDYVESKYHFVKN